MKKKLFVSACMLGVACRYDGKSKRVISDKDILRLNEKYELIPICPEQLGGLPTPRTPSERLGDRVVMKCGKDVTESFIRGADECVALARMLSVDLALLKERSPSCATHEVYDGSHSGVLKAGMGTAAEAMSEGGISVYSEDELELLLI